MPTRGCGNVTLGCWPQGVSQAKLHQFDLCLVQHIQLVDALVFCRLCNKLRSFPITFGNWTVIKPLCNSMIMRCNLGASQGVSNMQNGPNQEAYTYMITGHNAPFMEDLLRSPTMAIFICVRSTVWAELSFVLNINDHQLFYYFNTTLFTRQAAFPSFLHYLECRVLIFLRKSTLN